MITYDSEKCVCCNACIRACPVFEANIQEEKHDGTFGISIDNDKCIKCGACIRSCSHKARDFEDDTDRFLNDFRSQNIVLIVAPAIKVAFDGYWRHVLNWFKEKGVKEIYDVSLGADICTWAHLEYLKKYPNKKIISQPCAAIVNYVQKHNSKLIPHLSPVHSPMLCLAVYLKKYLGSNAKIAALSPCIAKKDEFMQTGLVDYNVTFDKLGRYFEKNNINLSNVRVSNSKFSSFEFDIIQGLSGSLYPRPGGLKDNLKYYVPNLNVINYEGVELIYRTLDTYLQEKDQNRPQVFDVLSCEYGCVGGPALGSDYSVFRSELIMHDVEEYLNKNSRDRIIKKRDKKFNKLKKGMDYRDFLRDYKAEDVLNKYPSQHQIDEVFNRLGKDTERKRNFNCHACGYKTCTEMAVAIYHGINFMENCKEYTLFVSNRQTQKIMDMLGQFTNISKQLKDVMISLGNSVDSVKGNTNTINDIGDECNVKIDDISNQFNQLQELSVNIKNAMQEIDESVQSFDVMNDDISSIAKQINILSLNANVEASRAGLLGKGFAVIADEIRKLAEKSQESVKTAQKSKGTVTIAVDNVDEIVNSITDTVNMLTSQIDSMKNDMLNSIESGKSIYTDAQDIEKVSDVISTLVNQTDTIEMG